MENTEALWWSIVFADEGFGICCVSLKLFCVRRFHPTEDEKNVSPGFSMPNELPMWGRIIQTKHLIRKFISQVATWPIPSC